MATQVKCACEKCSCLVDPGTALTKDGKAYCSEGCANGHVDGSGCSKPGCCDS